MSLLVYGAGGMGQETADWATAAGHVVAGYVDDDESLPGAHVTGMPVFRANELNGARQDDDVVVAISAPDVRAALAERLAGRLATVVHPSAQVAASTSLAAGVIVGPSVVITTNCTVEEAAIVTYGTVIGHGCTIGRAAFVGSGVAMAGDVVVEERAWIGIGATVLRGLTIGAGALVGAGAVVLEDVKPHTTVAGVPARPLH